MQLVGWCVVGWEEPVNLDANLPDTARDHTRRGNHSLTDDDERPAHNGVGKPDITYGERSKDVRMQVLCISTEKHSYSIMINESELYVQFSIEKKQTIAFCGAYPKK